MTENNKTYLGGIGKGNLGFLTKTINEVSAIVRNDLLSERFARKSGLLQGIDTRVKLVSMLFFMVLAGTSQSILRLILLGIVAALLAKLSGLGVVSYLKRVWLTLPLILLIVSIPASTSLFIPGQPLLYIHRGMDFYISSQGLLSVTRMAIRLGASFSFGYLLIMTTRWAHITKALGVLKVPRLVITILDMTYRYIFVLSRLSTEMFEARYLRTVGKLDNKENRGFISGSMAFLFIRSSHLSEEIFDAMVCRGFSGEPAALTEFGLTTNDFIWILNLFVITAVIVIL